MLDMTTVMSLQGTLFLLMFLGIIAGKAGIISQNGRKCLSDILIYIISPCNIIESFRQNVTAEFLHQALQILAISFGIQIFCSCINCVLYRRYSANQQQVLKYATICSNGNFIGIPIVRGIFGAQGVLFAALTLLPVRIHIWTYGIALFSGRQKKKEIVGKILLHPCIISIFAGFAMMLVHTYPPEPIWNLITSVGDCITPLAMLLVGSIIAEGNWRKIFNRTAIYYSLLRLILIPLAVFMVLRVLPLDDLVKGVSVVLAGMPAASLTAVFAEKYNSDVELASKCIVASTLFSIVTVPIICILLQM